MRKYLITMLLSAVAVIAGSAVSCNRDGSGTGKLQVRLMDAPSPYDFDAIYLDVIRVEVNVEPEGDHAEWIALSTGAGVYDIMTLVNGTDVVLAHQEIPAGQISQIRLILGTGNTIVVNGASHPLVIPSGQESGLKLNVHAYVADGEELTLMLDFDAAHSINVQGNGGYHLKPVMRAVVLEHSGAIHGDVIVSRGRVAVVATSNAGEFSTYSDTERKEFLLRGLPPGTYSVSLYYPDSDEAVMFQNVEVSANTVTELDGQ